MTSFSSSSNQARTIRRLTNAAAVMTVAEPAA